MPSIDSVILGLLPQSSLPEFYKTLVRNMLPNMSQIQKEEVYVSLKKASKRRESLEKSKESFLTKYEHIVTQLEDNPDEFVELCDFAEKKGREEKAVDKSDAKLSLMKQKMDLEALKQQLASKSSQE